MIEKSEYTVITDWDRQALYESFMKFDSPCYSMTIPLCVENIYIYAKMERRSFFLCMLYVLTKALNSVENFRMRNINGKPVIVHRPNVLTPVAISETDFCETLIQSDDNFSVFYKNAERNIEETERAGRPSIVKDMTPYIISCIPWFSYTGYTPADFSTHQTNPILAFGKYYDGPVPETGKSGKHINLTLRVNHCFVDAKHIGRFLDAVNDIQKSFTQTEPGIQSVNTGFN